MNKEVLAIDIEELVLDGRLQFRVGKGPYGTDKDTIERYQEVVKDGVELPPIEVLELSEPFEEYETSTLLVYGGFHRLCAYRLENKGLVDCHVRSGTWQDARCLAFRQNSDHGRPRSLADIGRVLEEIAKDYPRSNMREMAKLAGCSPMSVQRWQVPNAREPVNKKTAPPPPPPPPPPREERSEYDTVEDWDDEDVVTIAEQSDDDGERKEAAETKAEQPIPSPRADKPKEPEKEETVDPYADLREDRAEALDIVNGYRSLLKRVERLKGRRGGARLKYGICEKNTEDTRRHVDMFTPYIILPPEVIEDLGKDPSDGQGWLHKLGADRLDPAILSKCPKV